MKQERNNPKELANEQTRLTVLLALMCLDFGSLRHINADVC